MRVECFAATRPQQGRADKDNEDAFLVSLEDLPFAALCDGVGHPQRVAKKILQTFQCSCRASTSRLIADLSTWTGWVRALDSSVPQGYFSTFLAVVLLENLAVGVSVGNSRAYLLPRSGGFRHLTQGAAKESLGSGKAVPFPIRETLSLGDTLLLLSDGAWAPLASDSLQQIVAAEAPSRFYHLPNALLDFASHHARTDDMTALALRLTH